MRKKKNLALLFIVNYDDNKSLSVFYTLLSDVEYRFFLCKNYLIRGPPSIDFRKIDWRIKW